MALARGARVFAGATLLGNVLMSNGCKSSNESGSPPSAPMVASSTAPSSSAQVVEPPPPPADGELKTSSEVVFEVQAPKPGMMGPRVIAKQSEAALEEVRAHLAAHADAKIRIECAASSLKMSAMPNTQYPAGLAQKVAKWLVEKGVDCKRLAVVGILDKDPNAPGERVRFYFGTTSSRPADQETRLDACAK